MSQVTEQSVRFQTALPSIKLIQASAVLDLTEDDFDFLTSNKVWIATDRSRARRCVEACVYGTLAEAQTGGRKLRVQLGGVYHAEEGVASHATHDFRMHKVLLLPGSLLLRPVKGALDGVAHPWVSLAVAKMVAGVPDWVKEM